MERESIMNKDILIDLIKIIESDFKRRCEQSYDEEDRDKWGDNHGILKMIRQEIENGGIK
jgi:hypothetical protein